MTYKITRNRQELDATGQAVGRIATQVAMMLMGKNKADFARHIDAGDFVTVLNVGKVKFTGRKLVQKDYIHHTMHRGGLTTTAMKHVFEKNPAVVMRKAVYRMLPKNSHREKMMKRLTVKA